MISCCLCVFSFLPRLGKSESLPLCVHPCQCVFKSSVCVMCVFVVCPLRWLVCFSFVLMPIFSSSCSRVGCRRRCLLCMHKRCIFSWFISGLLSVSAGRCSCGTIQGGSGRDRLGRMQQPYEAGCFRRPSLPAELVGGLLYVCAWAAENTECTLWNLPPCCKTFESGIGKRNRPLVMYVDGMVRYYRCAVVIS